MTEAGAKFIPDGGWIKALIIKGRERGYLTIEEIMECIPPGIIEQEQIDDIVRMIEDMGIEVAR
ncbi:MAG: hypothetical protein GY951_12860 [Psychromonas sp.]|nr:hypothetical protein [Psychromonas sp.]